MACLWRCDVSKASRDKIFINCQVPHKQKVEGLMAWLLLAPVASPLRPLPTPHSVPPGGGGLWSLVSGQHSSAVHWVALEAMACSELPRPEGRDPHFRLLSSCQQLATTSGPRVYVCHSWLPHSVR